MPETFNIPEDMQKYMSDQDWNRADQLDRNIKICQSYDGLRDELGRDAAFRELAERHDVQPSTVKAIVYGQR